MADKTLGQIALEGWQKYWLTTIGMKPSSAWERTASYEKESWQAAAEAVLNRLPITALSYKQQAVIEAAKALVEAQTKAADEASVAVAEWRLKENVDALEAAEKEGE